MTPEEQAFAAFLQAVDAIYIGIGVLSVAMSVVSVVLVALALRRDQPTLLSVGAVCWLSAAILSLVWVGQELWILTVLQAVSVPLVVALELGRHGLVRFRSARGVGRAPVSSTETPQTDAVATA